uniref:NADH-ubiquinone oxidoreductase chain 2 n=1 Tax=Tanaocerus koebelei TaxID=1260746 RepID=M4JDU7_9ORTH|nr:NADH dehydrogenase subunit 2 [Tanaocerus koebelei]AGC22373.1 NADH dehydrogenase subunit 2 [Tanaocerus koebelei]
MLFLFTLVMGSLVSISSNSWFGVWMGLEINLLSFLFPYYLMTKTKLINETSIKYFIIQALASTMLIFSIIMIQMNFSLYWENLILPTMMISSSLLLKVGAAPLHFWFPEVMSSCSWINCFILMTWQKIAPMMVLSYCLKINMFMFFIVITSMFIGAIGGLNQTSLRQLMAYSSISHIGWMISSMLISETMWETYFLIYSMLSLIMTLMFNQLNMFFMNQLFFLGGEKMETKFILFLSLLSMGGLPPFIGFMPKWLVIQSLIENNLSYLISIMVILTTITLYYYMRVSFSSLILASTENKWMTISEKSKWSQPLSSTIMISSVGLLSMPTILLYL